MGELVKKWNDGGSLSVAYDGDGDGTAVFSSDANEGLDREVSVTFKAASLTIDAIARQAGRREVFSASDGGFILSDGTFNVLK